MTEEQAKLFAYAANVHGKKTLNREDTTQYVGFLLCDMENSREYFCDGYALNIDRLHAFTQIPKRTLELATKELREYLKERRNIRIAVLSESGMSNREIAREIGVGKDTVNSVVSSGGKAQVAENRQSQGTQSPPKAPDVETTTSKDETPPWLQDLPVIDDDMDEGLPEDFDAKLEALQEHDQKGWDTIARNMAKAVKKDKSKTVQKTMSQITDEFAKSLDYFAVKCMNAEERNPDLSEIAKRIVTRHPLPVHTPVHTRRTHRTCTGCTPDP
ncbi:helix-turn-helix domain-containing protein [uncultured Microbulbifer sp.]|uniref:helix-turn-helix domain-containing protein n=1 Tax=uncultured Microbulbifer sp. TaxID=348147 RepID=UPI0025E2F647|nr:helix-turn-helix domain-containing protein [uncultured Microbulbifer sp.]